MPQRPQLAVALVHLSNQRMVCQLGDGQWLHRCLRHAPVPTTVTSVIEWHWLIEWLSVCVCVCSYAPSQADVSVFESLGVKPASQFAHAVRWFNHISSFTADDRKKYTTCPALLCSDFGMNLLQKSLQEITVQCISEGTSNRITTLIHSCCQKTPLELPVFAFEVLFSGHTPTNSHTLSS